MTLELFIFYLFAVITLSSAVGVVTARNPVYAALFLILALRISKRLYLESYKMNVEGKSTIIIANKAIASVNAKPKIA